MLNFDLMKAWQIQLRITAHATLTVSSCPSLSLEVQSRRIAQILCYCTVQIQVAINPTRAPPTTRLVSGHGMRGYCTIGLGSS